MIKALGIDVGSSGIKLAQIHYEKESKLIKNIDIQTININPFSKKLEADITFSFESLEKDYDRIGLTVSPLLFSSYSEAVLKIISALESLYKNIPIYLPLCNGKISKKENIKDIYQAISSNYVPTAFVVSSIIQNGFLIDAGGSTTDINIIKNGKPVFLSKYSWERLGTNEVISIGKYTTPSFAIVNNVDFCGKNHSLIYSPIALATMSDLLCILNKISNNEYSNMTKIYPFEEAFTGKEKAIRLFAKSLGMDIEWIRREGKESELIAAAEHIYRKAIDSISFNIAELSKKAGFQRFDNLQGVVTGAGKDVLSYPALKNIGIYNICDMSSIFGKDLTNKNEESAACLALMVARL